MTRRNRVGPIEVMLSSPTARRSRRLSDSCRNCISRDGGLLLIDFDARRPTGGGVDANFEIVNASPGCGLIDVDLELLHEGSTTASRTAGYRIERAVR